MSVISKVRKFTEKTFYKEAREFQRWILFSNNMALDALLDFFDVVYDLTSARQRKLLCKAIKLKLQTKHEIQPGAMLVCKNGIIGKNALKTQVKKSEFAKWIVEGALIMYLDVVNSERHEEPTLKFLYDEKVLFLHLEKSMFGWYNSPNTYFMNASVGKKKE